MRRTITNEERNALSEWRTGLRVEQQQKGTAKQNLARIKNWE